MTSSASDSGSLPDAVHLSVRDALRLNAWAAVAVVLACLARLWSKSPELTGLARAAVALLPLLPALLYLRTLRRWMLSLDEMQLRLQLQAVNFALLSMLLIALATDLLRTAGFAQGMNFGWEGYFTLTFLLYAAGVLRANRRFQ